VGLRRVGARSVDEREERLRPDILKLDTGPTGHRRRRPCAAA